MDPLWRIEDDGSLVFDPNAGQRAFIESPAQEVLFSGHWGNGKSIALVMKLWAFCLRYPGARCVLLRKVYADLRLSTLRHVRRVFGDAMWFGGLVGGERPERFDFPNGSSIDFIGVSGESGRTDKLLSTEYAFIAADECNELEEADWEMAMGRLRQPGIPIHQIVGCTNPDNPEHWLCKRFLPNMGTNRQRREDECDTCRGTGSVKQWLHDEDTGEDVFDLAACPACSGTLIVDRLIRECVVAGMNENDEHQPAAYLAFKRNLKGQRRQRYFEGKWVAFEGLVYSDWDPNVHLCGPKTDNPLPSSWARWAGLPPPDWERVVGIDLGYDNPFSCQWIAISPDGDWYRYRELYMSNVTVDLHGKEILRLEAEELAALRARAIANARFDGKLVQDTNEWGSQGRTPWDAWLESLNVTAYYSDHDRGERALLEREGVYTTAAKKDITAGIQTVAQLLMPQATGRPKLFIVRGARVEEDPVLLAKRLPTCLEEEFGGYHWDKRKTGILADVPRDLPVDKNNHGLDALRYAVHSHTVAGRAMAY